MAYPALNLPLKNCKACGTELTRRPKEQSHSWKRRIFCDCSCAGRYNSRGRPATVRSAPIIAKHGHARIGKQSSTYRTWKGMIRRCANPHRPEWKHYGGRGIIVCERWRVFANFLADMGERPEGLTLDRVDNNGNYEPSNCRWATLQQQSNNTRANKWITYNGTTDTQSGWSHRLGIHLATLRSRIEANKPISIVLSPDTQRPWGHCREK